MTHIVLASVTLNAQETPFLTPINTAYGEIVSRKTYELILTDKDGVTAQSECVSMDQAGYDEETLEDSYEALNNVLIPEVIGQVLDITTIGATLDSIITGNHYAKAALEMGVWALAAKKIGAPLWTLLGAKTQVPRPLTQAIGIKSSAAKLKTSISDAINAGVKHIKLKIQPGNDVGYIPNIHEMKTVDTKIWVDANGSYSSGDEALLKQLSHTGIDMIEQPFSDMTTCAELQNSLGIPIALDESIRCLQDAIEMKNTGSGQVVILKPGRVGGFTESLRIIDFCQDNGIDIYIGGMWEGAVGQSFLDDLHSVI
ncbi:hypothetical protein HOH87_02095 [bacterium]|jgi:o-succinylbenzoate synthase|nr:hypothetical protein [bacterium]